MKRIFKLKLRWQYFASYLAILLVTLGVFFTFSFNSFCGFHAQNVMDNYENRLGLICGEQEDVLEDMVAIAGEIMSVTSIVPFEYCEEPDKANRLINQLSSYRATHIIEHRFSEPELSVRDIAVELGMSDSRLSVKFKKAFHMTPLERITSARMKRARRLLNTTDMPIKDIALECGYYDISGFNRRFKAYTGMTPQQYKLADEAQIKEES